MQAGSFVSVKKMVALKQNQNLLRQQPLECGACVKVPSLNPLTPPSLLEREGGRGDEFGTVSRSSNGTPAAAAAARSRSRKR